MTDGLKLVIWLGAVAPLIAGATAASHACDGTTSYAWKRSFHAYYALEQPLRSYYISRVPGYCGSGIRLHECAAFPYPPDAAAALEPVGMEHLGVIPNDLAFDTTAPRR